MADATSAAVLLIDDDSDDGVEIVGTRAKKTTPQRTSSRPTTSPFRSLSSAAASAAAVAEPREDRGAAAAAASSASSASSAATAATAAVLDEGQNGRREGKKERFLCHFSVTFSLSPFLPFSRSLFSLSFETVRMSLCCMCLFSHFFFLSVSVFSVSVRQNLPCSFL
jgi:hypothetical protein